MEVTAEDLVRFVKTHKKENFKKHIPDFVSDNNFMDFINECDKTDLDKAISWSRGVNVHLVHRIFERIEKVDSDLFSKILTDKEILDAEKRTLLHVAAWHGRCHEVLEYLINTRGDSILSEDEYGYTPLHYYCQTGQFNAHTLNLLMHSQDHLTRKSNDGLTPLEFACSNENNLKVLLRLKGVRMKEILKSIDDVSDGFMDVETYPLLLKCSNDRVWLNLLQKNDPYLLLSYLKNDSTFADKCYFEPNDMVSIIKNCSENGQGILSHIRDRFFRDGNVPSLRAIFIDLSGLTPQEAGNKANFYKTALFLVVITGRFSLVSPLLRCCQFDIVPYAMIICLICRNFEAGLKFPDQVVKDIISLKDFCEQYCIAVTNSTYDKDLSKDKTIIGAYISKDLRKLDNKSILQIAYHAKCTQFLGLPSCQESLTQVWTEYSYRCPRIKFILHSLAHIIFLILFSYVIVNHLYVTISPMECICYTYGLGYAIEELRQIFLLTRDKVLQSYAADASNIIDILALLFMLIGFVLRVSLKIPFLADLSSEYRLFLESKQLFLFLPRLFLCLSLIAFYMRVLYFASLTRILGPKLKMISTMISRDLIPLLFIFSIFLISFGVSFQSLLFPNNYYAKAGIVASNVTFDRKNIISLIADIFRRATFTIFNFHHTLNDIEGTQNTYVADPYGQYAVYFLLLIFMIVVNVMLMHLLTALFSNTVSRINLKSTQSWKSSRFGFIHEYAERTLAPPPFNIFMITIEVITHYARHWTKTRKRRREDEETASSRLIFPGQENPDESSISYYIYQAFALSGKRFKLLKDVKDFEYERSVQLKNIEERMERNKSDLERTITERCKMIEDKLGINGDDFL